VFNIESLVDFILATGDFSDPETRLPFSDQDLLEIDALVRTCADTALECSVAIHIRHLQ
jgi:hypothetical protein